MLDLISISFQFFFEKNIFVNFLVLGIAPLEGWRMEGEYIKGWPLPIINFLTFPIVYFVRN